MFVVVVPSSFSISPSSCVRFLLLFFFLRFTSRYVSFFCVRYLEVSSGIFVSFVFARACVVCVFGFFLVYCEVFIGRGRARVRVRRYGVSDVSVNI